MTTHAQLTEASVRPHAQLTEASHPEVEGRGKEWKGGEREGIFSAAPKNRGLLRKRGHHIAAQVVTQGASLTSVQARAIHAGRVTTPDFPWIARFSASIVEGQERSNEATA